MPFTLGTGSPLALIRLDKPPSTPASVHYGRASPCAASQVNLYSSLLYIELPDLQARLLLEHPDLFMRLLVLEVLGFSQIPL